jgi:ribulose-phosphate 3-epimerase
MIQNPENTIKDYLLKYVKQVLFHIESTSKADEVLSILEKAGVKKGLAINPDTETSTLEPYISKVDTILFMTVYPGYYGRPMVTHVLEKAKAFKEKYPHLNIGMDGGIKENNLGIIKDTGVDFACVGSAIAMASDPKEAYQRMVKQVA